MILIQKIPEICSIFERIGGLSMKHIKYIDRIKNNISLLQLHESLCNGTISNGSMSEFSNNENMKKLKKDLEKEILNKIHPYKIYESKTVPGQWFTHLPDESRPEKRRKIKRMGYDNIRAAVINYYREQYHLDITMGELFDEYAKFRRDETSAKSGTIRKDVSLWKTYCGNAMIDGHIFGKIKVSEIKTITLFKFFRSLTKERQYTRKTVYNIRGVLSGMFAYAIERGIIQSNTINDLDIKHLSFKPNPKKHNTVFTYEDAQTLLSYLKTIPDDPYVLAIRLDFNLFARIGEIAGLRWENVDLDNRMVYICKQITYEPELQDDMSFSNKKMVEEDYIKGCTEEGYRDEHLSDEAVEILKLAKKINPDGEYVFMPFGRPIITGTFNKRLKRYCLEAGVPYHSSHKIRFYTASMA